ncbi:hypothetical protein [Algoriphagus terrigena]|uniref:hypothetical protein n=1 Tax=Algoriphagus terrigena TaxID=344884 RepID=UPI0003FC7BBF|nr:hypothetical protein [Algoriphagus terrigena]
MTTAEYSINTRYRLGNAWGFHIGGYQPAPKWIKDGILDFEDIMHYEEIIKTLAERERVIREIDGVGI